MGRAPDRGMRRRYAAAPLLMALLLSVCGNLLAAVVFSTALVRPWVPPPEPVVVELIEEPPPREPSGDPPLEPPTAQPVEPAAAQQSPDPDRTPESPPRPSPELEAPAEPEPEPEALPEPEPVPSPEPEAPPEPPPPPPDRERAQSVAQAVSNDEESPEARFLAERANRVERETIAEITSLDSPSQLPELADAPAVEDAPLGEGGVETTPEPAAPELVAMANIAPQPAREAQPARPAIPASPEVAPQPAAPAAAPAPSASQPDRAGAEAPPAPTQPLTLAEAMRRAAEAQPGSDAVAAVAATSYQAYVGTFAAREGADRARLDAAERAGALGGDHEARWDRTRAALENFDVLVERGSETGLNTRSDAYAGYIHSLHNAIHPHWAAYLNHLDFQQGPASPLADPSLYVVLEFAIAADGVVRDVRVRRTSGRIEYDAEAIDIIWRISPQRSPPEVARSPDGLTYVRWEMHRDAQMCHSSGASIHVLAAE